MLENRGLQLAVAVEEFLAHLGQQRAAGRHLLVGTAPMGLLAEVVYPSSIGGSVPIPSGQGTWLTVGGGRVQHWMLPPLPGEQLQLPLT